MFLVIITENKGNRVGYLVKVVANVYMSTWPR